uniref:Dead/deah box helicase domain protein n=1 Tax=Methylobacterium oryzae CBMB20 TaxID=693986 RepID=A0A088B2A0_9HYPH|nr:DEAD/DEAH box helicase [Methylobacterium oryzae]AGO88290.1 Dead/deah box helicase domain protein [Methylobacterium oryzae CBMB20]
METTEELQTFLADLLQPDVWGQLIARGAAWSLMREGGVLPQGAPAFGSTIEIDLIEHGFSVLRAALALRELGTDPELARKAFERAANTFEALVRNGDLTATERGFLRTIAAAAYHLASYSAIAYSLFSDQGADLNTTIMERVVTLLILRDFANLRTIVQARLRDEAIGETGLVRGLSEGEMDADDVIQLVLNTAVCKALAFFDFALQTGDEDFFEYALITLDVALRLADNAAAVPLWWIIRLVRNLIADLWHHSLHRNLPLNSPVGGEEKYPVLRRMFIDSLYGRRNAEVELWPSQREAAVRSTDLTDDLVVALPTSAGKTRIAEIAALMTLSTGKRVLIVTPLRALSAQTEHSFRRTFGPLGFKVSSLYGASGVSEGDEDALRSRPIVIATPEKLDFALRSDAGLIGDVGLIVFDEGHLIGPSEREIRYEILVQRLLRRPDAHERRIVCLSAILPEGEALDDLTAWMRSDAPGAPVKSTWRPTRQRFGSIVWQGRSARLNFDLRNDGPYVARFVDGVPPRGRERKPYPRHVRDLTLFAAWRFAAQGKRTLVFSTQANWVEGFGTTAVDLVRRGYFDSLIEDPGPLSRALEVGREWLGADHPAVQAMSVGVAIHHGKLPQPFLREMELLLGAGVLKVIIASPTLAQGLNLNAAVLLVPYLVRSGQEISGEEFANVAGRAGRAFVDVEGLVLHVIFDRERSRLDRWRHLIQSARSRDLQSGLFQVIAEVLERLSQAGILSRPNAFEYLANAREGWQIAEAPADEGEDAEGEDADENAFSTFVEKLDAMILGLIEALDADRADLPRLLDEALTGSLWARKLTRASAEVNDRHRALLRARANLIWTLTTPEARKGHFAMGVGLESGLALDAIAHELGPLADAADAAALQGDVAVLTDTLVALAQRLLVIRPFAPETGLVEGWEGVLRAWVSGSDVEQIGAARMKVVEDAFAYRLVWGLEAVRTRRMASGWTPDIVAGGGAAAVETGLPHLMMAMLVRAGLPSRRAAIAAIQTGGAEFIDSTGMRAWLLSSEVAELSSRAAWPTIETAALWRRFRNEVVGNTAPAWKVRTYLRRLEFMPGQARPPNGDYRVEIDQQQRSAWLLSVDFRRIARVRRHVHDPHPALYRARLVEGDRRAHIERAGPGFAEWEVE